MWLVSNACITQTCSLQFPQHLITFTYLHEKEKKPINPNCKNVPFIKKTTTHTCLITLITFGSITALVQFLPAESTSTSSELKYRGPTCWGSVSSPVTQVVGRPVEHATQNRASWEALARTEHDHFYYRSSSRVSEDAAETHKLCSSHTSSLWLLCITESLASGR